MNLIGGFKTNYFMKKKFLLNIGTMSNFRKVTLWVCILCVVIFIVNSKIRKNEVNLEECSLDLVNSVKLEQDDPCLIKIIRDQFLFSPSTEPLAVQMPAEKDPSVGQAQIVRELNKNQTKGFFVECGALDGVVSSNTLYLERNLQWEGLLIEADPANFKLLRSKNRRSWTVPACISNTGESKIVTFKQGFDVGQITDLADVKVKRPGQIEIQCFPFYSILLAVGRTKIDFFSLDIEGGELDVLKTIPWKLVDIKILAVEYLFIKEGKAVLANYMEKQGYEIAREYNRTDWRAYDYIFVKK